jgi:predicted peptidase
MKRWQHLTTALSFGLALLICTPGSRAADDQKPEPGKQQAQKLERTIKVTFDYLLYLPKDYSQKDSWPLLLFLHGAGERGDNLERVKVHGPPKLIAAGKDFPFIVVSPQCPSNRWWQPHELSGLLDEIVEKCHVDQDRIYVTGLSMGGYGTWSLAGFAPDRFAALVPICGGGDVSAVRRFARIPVWVFHGAKDPVVPLSASENMVEALKKAKGDVKFTVYPEAGHDSWTEAYNDPQLYTWLLEQKRKPRQPEGAKRGR